MPNSGWVYYDKGIVRADSPIDGLGKFRLRAEHIRRSSTGPHASVTIALGDVDLADDLFNLLRGEERKRLARRAFERLGNMERAALPRDVIEAALDRFCKQVWQASVEASDVVEAGADEEPSPPTFALDPYIMDGGGTILFGPPGAGKSYTDYTMTLSIEYGWQAIWPCERRRSLHINLERSPESVNRRVFYLARALGLPSTTKLRMIHARGKRLEAIYDRVANAIQADGYEFLSLDSIVRAGYGKLTDDDTGNAIIDVLNSLCPTWIAIGGSPRGDSDHAFGSVMFDYGEDVGVKLSSQRSRTGPILGVALEVTKRNDGAYPPPELLAYEFDGYHLLSVRKAKASEFPSLATGKPIDVIDQVYDLLLDAGAMSATDIASELGSNRSNVSLLLNSDQRFCRVRKEGKSVLYGIRRDGS